MEVRLLNGDCLVKLKELDENSVDSIVTDPPYELGFMGKGWDSSGIAFNVDVWKECLRVLKPGGHILAFGGTRTYHRMTVAIEDAGFEIRDCIAWMYGSGFPKSHNIGKAVDKLEGNEREVVGLHERQNLKKGGAALKPAFEPVVMGRKPFKGTVAQNVLENGVGGLNIDGCRVGNETMINQPAGDNDVYNTSWKGSKTQPTISEGRFPANVILDEEAGKILDEQSGNIKGGKNMTPYESPIDNPVRMNSSKQINRIGYEDNGGASRFFYCPKTSKKDRNEGCDELPQKANVFMSPDSRTNKEHYDRTSPGMERFKTEPKSNFHPTVKPTDLMSYLIRLVTPKGGVVLDPFMGSGSTGKGAVREGMDFIGIEREEEYYQIAQSRIEHEQKKNNHTQWFE
jgi:site-specific DNA-methyltransferase (adenine-specific)